MTIDEIRARKCTAEIEIGAVLRRLQKNTGLCGISVNVEVIRTQAFTAHRPQFAETRVTIQLEQI